MKDIPMKKIRLKSNEAIITSDYIIWGFVLRRLSYYPSWLFLKIGFSANQVTVLSLLVGCLGCLYSISGNFIDSVIGAVLLNIWGILDCSDGTIARVTNTATEYGAALDGIVGTVLISFLFLCIGMGQGSTFILLGIWCSLFQTFTRTIFTIKEAKRMKFFSKKNVALKDNILRIGYNITNAIGIIGIFLTCSILGILKIFVIGYSIISPIAFITTVILHLNLLKERVRESIIVGYAFIVGDLLHYGHIHFLRECKKHCDFLIVGVYTDELTETYKRHPIIPFEERIELIKELKLIDKVVVVHNRNCTPMLKKLTDEGWKISYLFHGDDWSPESDEDLRKSREFIERMGGKLIQPKYYEGRTTTSTIKEILREYENEESIT